MTTNSTPNPLTAQLASRPALLMLILLTVDSLHFVFARLLRPLMSPFSASFYVLAIATLEVGIYLIIKRRLNWQLLREKWWFFTAIGFLVAVSTLLNYIAVRYIDPGTASLLGQTSIIFAMLMGVIWLRERLSTLEWLGALVALAGTFVISFQPGDFTRIGSLMVLAGATMYPLHAAIVKRYGGEMDFANFFFFRIFMTAVFLGLIAVGGGELEAVRNGRSLLTLLLVGTVDVVISRILYYLALRRLNLSLHAILLTLSPVITIGWSLLLFGELPTMQGILGGTAVICGIAFVSWANSRPTEGRAE